jgi:protein ImuB
MRNPRLACARIHNFALELWLAQNPGRRDHAVVLVDDGRDDALIRQCNAPASRAGVRAGMTMAQGNALCAGLRPVVYPDVPEQEESHRLLATLQRLSPQVEETSPGLYFLSFAGLIRLYGSEQALARRILAAVAACGLPVTVGVAATATAARIAAEISTPGTFTIIPRGRERHFLGGLTVAFLLPSPAVARQLEALGLATIAQLAALPPGELARRFGPEGAHLHALATGSDRTPTVFAALPSDTMRTVQLSFACTQQSTLVAHVRRLAGALCFDLARRDRAATGLRVELQCEDGASTTFTLGVDRPAVSASPFMRQLGEQLKSARFKAGVVRIAVALEGVTSTPVHQLEWSRPGSPGAGCAHGKREGLSTPAAPLALPRLVASHLPEESFTLQAESSQGGRTNREGPGIPAYASGSLAGMRLFTPPQRTAVTEERGIPRTFSLGTRIRAIDRRWGPWELSGRWWGRDFDRRYFEIATGPGERYLLFYDRLAACWYLQGVFD